MTERTLDLSSVEAPSRTLDPGAAVGRYLVLSLLGQGGMGEVYAADDPELGRHVALKLLRPARGSEGSRRSLLREARALGQLSHPHVVQVYDAGEHNGDVFIAMEMIRGTSLDVWARSEPRPSWRAVLAAYLAAARGLAAAHEKGITHRDVKPSNILRGDDGRVCVADFGIAAADDGLAPLAPVLTPPRPLPAAGDASGLEDTQRAAGRSVDTLSNKIVGTPLYMAPEQYVSAAVGPACDQYALCVALYEALYGVNPFPAPQGVEGHELRARHRAAKLAGLPPTPPAGAVPPAWLYPVLARGLAPRPDDRYPSMAELIAALGRDRDAERRVHMRWLAAAVGAVGLLTVAAAGWVRAAESTDPCAHPELSLTGVWDEGVKQRVRAALGATGRPYAQDTAERTEALLDRQAQQLTAMRGEVCRASQRGAQGSEVLLLRDACLDRRLGQLQALTTVLADKPDADVLDKTTTAAGGLDSVASCSDVAELMARVHLPKDPTLRARVATLERRVDTLQALHTAGRYRDGLAVSEPLLAELAEVPFAPTRARGQYWVGRLKDGSGDYPGARALLLSAAVSASEAKDDAIALNAWSYLLVVAGQHMRRWDEVSALRLLGPTALARVTDPAVRATWIYAQGAVLNASNRPAESRPLFEQALALREQALGPDHPDVAMTLNTLGNAELGDGDYAAARAHYERVIAITQKTFGPRHPMVGTALANLGILLDDTGAFEEAAATHARALAIFQEGLGPDHPHVGSVLENLGTTLLHLGQYSEAKQRLARALAIFERASRPDYVRVAACQAHLGRAEIHLGHLEAAEQLLNTAKAALDKIGDEGGDDVGCAILGLAELRLARHQPALAVADLTRDLARGSPRYVGDLQLTMAEALWQVGQKRERARELAGSARDRFAAIGHGPGVERATRWLAEHASR